MKRIFKIFLKVVIGFIGFVILYLLVQYCLSRITVKKEPGTKEEVTIYILTNGVHTDIVVPIKSDQYDWSQQVKFSNTRSQDTSFNYLAMGWGDKGFYLETPEWKDLKASVAFKAAFGLGSTAIHATFYKTMIVSDSCRQIMISKAQYQRLIDYITGSFERDANGNFKNIVTNAVYGEDDAFYDAKGSYSMLHTCNTWANTGLKKSGQKCCLWTAFDTGIFLKYK
ncbi:MAG: TIGR02117 family protein [Pseudopedobacter saltans]|uniref:TIGR02117 family protein n=1 Tax=Pseudopedobacter saltans TaxID=151895 RepID=A0A2W5FG51_9SPHI|nr:MAG: TIGR02117 family protein [Pseudopedobacter saltans]